MWQPIISCLLLQRVMFVFVVVFQLVFIAIQLLYSVVLVSNVLQKESVSTVLQKKSAIYIHGPAWQHNWSRIHLHCRRPQFNFWVGKIRWRRNRLSLPVFLSFPCGSAVKESACNVGDLGWIPGLGRFPGEGKGYPLQYSGLENSMDYKVHGVAKSRTQLSDFHSLTHSGTG